MHSRCRGVNYTFQKPKNQNTFVAIVFFAYLCHDGLSSTLLSSCTNDDSSCIPSAKQRALNHSHAHDIPHLTHDSSSHLHKKSKDSSKSFPEELSRKLDNELSMTAVSVIINNIKPNSVGNQSAYFLPPAPQFRHTGLYSSSYSSFPLVTTTVLGSDSIPYRVTFEDPCAAKGFVGDIALSDAEFEKFNRRNQTQRPKEDLNRPRFNKPITSTSDASSARLRHANATRSAESSRENRFTINNQDGETESKTSTVDTNYREPAEDRAKRGNGKATSDLNTNNHSDSKFEASKPISSPKIERIKPHSSFDGDELEGLAPSNPRARRRRAATARTERLWDHAVVPFVVDSNFSGAHKALFQQAMRHWENYTCITFVERTTEKDYIIFTVRPCGCCSFVGKRGNGPQAISIGNNCDKFGIVVHELGHVIGFWHEHTRPDRDRHVLIIRKNIIPNQEYNFNVLGSSEVYSMGEPYDYGSIMHYARNTFSRGTYLDTILPKIREGQKKPDIGQRVWLSDGDVKQAKKLYRCPPCGKTMQDPLGEVSSPNYPKPDTGNERFCQWRISATHGEKIVLNITHMNIELTRNCYTNYLEVRDGHYHRAPLLGRFCGSGRLPPLLKSSGPRLWIEYRSSYGNRGYGFRAHYEAICGGDIFAKSKGDGETKLSSPNFPDEYQGNKNCIWKISVPTGYAVALSFQTFEIEKHDGCVYDFLEVRDGLNSNSPIIGRYCGYASPGTIKSTSNKLWVKFVSDGTVNKGGFQASFTKEFDECAARKNPCDHTCINMDGGGFKCKCRLGFELHQDGFRCTKIPHVGFKEWLNNNYMFSKLPLEQFGKGALVQKFLITPEYDDYDDSGEVQLGFKPEARKAEELRKKERRKTKEELRQKEIEWAHRRERERRRKTNRAKLSRQLKRKIGNKKTTFKIVKVNRQGPPPRVTSRVSPPTRKITKYRRPPISPEKPTPKGRSRLRGENSSVSSKSSVKSSVRQVPITKQLLVQTLVSKRAGEQTPGSLPQSRMKIRRPVYPSPTPKTQPPRPSSSSKSSSLKRRRKEEATLPPRPSSSLPPPPPIFSRPRRPPTKNEGPVRRTLFSSQISAANARKPERPNGRFVVNPWREHSRGPSIPGRPARPIVVDPSRRLRPVGPHAARPLPGKTRRVRPQPTGPHAARPRPLGPHVARPRPVGPHAARPSPVRRLSRRWRPRTVRWSSDDDKHIASDDDKRYERKNVDQNAKEWGLFKTAFPAKAIDDDESEVRAVTSERGNSRSVGLEVDGKTNSDDKTASAKIRSPDFSSGWRSESRQTSLVERVGWEDLDGSNSEQVSFHDEMMEFFYKQ